MVLENENFVRLKNLNSLKSQLRHETKTIIRNKNNSKIIFLIKRTKYFFKRLGF